MIRRFAAHAALGMVAGLLAGPALGLGEWLAITQISGQPDTGALSFAIIAYTIVAALVGIGLGVLGALLGVVIQRRSPNRIARPISAWTRLARYWAVNLSLIGVIVARFRIVRDAFDGSLPIFSPAGLLVHAGLLVAPLMLIGLVWWSTRSQSRSMAQAQPEAKESAASDSQSAPDPSRRRFLKTALTAGLVAAPPVAAAARLFGPTANTLVAPSVIRTTGVLSSALRNRPNIIYLMIDTLRADHLSCYGYPKVVSPRIDTLAAEGIRFEHNCTQASWTKSCVACQLTSLYPASHRAQYKVDRLPDAVTTLPEVLARHGYATAGYAANVNVAPLFNFQQGFHSYEFLSPTALFGASESASQLAVYQGLRLINERFVSSATNVYNFYYPAEAINERAMDWMSRHLDQRFFMFLHYMDPHDPYFEHPYNGYGIARVSTPNPSPDMADEIKRLYVDEIAYLDRQLGELFDWLKKQGLYDDTMIVLTSDHGEEFYEHGGWWHGYTLYEEVIHVPLIVKLPGSNDDYRGMVDTGINQAIDIAPTILSAVNIPRPPEMQGVDLLNPKQRTDTAYAEEGLEGNIMRAVRRSNWKYIETKPDNPRGMPEHQLFDLAVDRGETRNLADGESDRVTQMLSDADRIQTWAIERAVATEQTDIDATTLQQLRNIGY